MNRAQRRALSKSHQRPPTVGNVVLGYCHPGEVSESFMASVLAANAFHLRRSGSTFGTLAKMAGTGNVAHVRNLITENFLKTDAEWLWFVDADMGFPEWALERLLGAATHEGLKPVVAGLCFALSIVDINAENNAVISECFPTIGIWNRDDTGQIIGWRYLTDYPVDEVVKVDTTGAACVLIHRSALETIGEDWWTHIAAPKGVMGVNQRTFFGEDVSFFMRCAEHEIPVWLDTVVKTSHHKGGVYLTHELYQEQEAIKAAKEKYLAEQAS